jgi:hypothetical protein
VVPLVHSSRNATNLAFRLFAPLIRRPLRNLSQVSVHSFSLMKLQISFTNNSCVTSKQPGPSQCTTISLQIWCLCHVCASQNRCYHRAQIKVSILSPSVAWRDTEISDSQGDIVWCSQHATKYLSIWCLIISYSEHVYSSCNSGLKFSAAYPGVGAQIILDSTIEL